MNTTVNYPLTIYYDASCPLCTREVQMLTRYDDQHQLRLVDCSTPDFTAVEGHSRDAMMALIHARDASGTWLIGPPVFAASYRAAGFASIASLLASARLQPLWNYIYPKIANNRGLLSRLGAITALTWVLHRLHARAVKKALAASQRCKAGSCDLP